MTRSGHSITDRMLKGGGKREEEGEGGVERWEMSKRGKIMGSSDRREREEEVRRSL